LHGRLRCASQGGIALTTSILDPFAMLRTLCKSKIHRAVLTGADLHYEGSITVDRTLMDAADLVEYEKVQVVNVNNGARLETYVIAGDADSGVVQLNGAAARHGHAGDLVIIISYADFEEREIDGFVPRKVFVDAKNRITPGGIELE
jgi:aspartate 1-decarboxylase